jgi:hypothetical protein
VDRRRPGGLLLSTRLCGAIGPRFLLRNLLAQHHDNAMLGCDLVLIFYVDADFIVVCAALSGVGGASALFARAWLSA